MILLASLRRDGMAPVTGALELKDTGSLRRTGRGDEEEVLSSMSVTSWRAWISTWVWIRSPPRAHGSGLKAGQ